MANKSERLELKVIIHPTPASLRFGGDGYYVTFAGTEEDSTEAMMLNFLKGKLLKITIEQDDETQNREKPERSWPRLQENT